MTTATGGCQHGPGHHPAPDLCPNCGTVTPTPDPPAGGRQKPQHSFWGQDPSGYCGCADCTAPDAADSETPAGGLTGFWDRLGMDEGGLPAHLPMGVNADGQGPEADSDAHHVECWCPDPTCPLTAALALAAVVVQARAEDRARIEAVSELVADHGPAPYPAECDCPHGMGFQFHRWPCKWTTQIDKAQVRAALTTPRRRVSLTATEDGDPT